jgi:hypothetical protein
MRQLLGDSACVLCKRTLEHVVMTASVEKEFEDFQIWGDGSAAVCKIEGRELPFDEPAQAFFDDKRMLDEVKFLRSLTCPKCPQPPGKGAFVAKDLKELAAHTQTHHGVAHCALCVEFRKEFVQEQKLFKRHELKLHEKSGDQGNGPFKGHPLCEFCNTRFYDDSALWGHLRKDHYTCHICEKFRGIQVASLTPPSPRPPCPPRRHARTAAWIAGRHGWRENTSRDPDPAHVTVRQMLSIRKADGQWQAAEDVGVACV